MTEANTQIEEVVDDQTKTQTSAEDTAKTADETVTETTTETVDETAKATTENTEEKAPALPDNWRELAAGEDEDALKLLKRYGSLNGVAKALVEKEKIIRAGVKKSEMPDPKDEKAMAAWRKAEGIPEKAEDYKLPEPITKRLIDADKPVLANFTEFAHGKNAPPAFVEMAAEWYVDMSEKAAEAQSQADDKAKEDAEDALRDSWSRDEYKGNLTLAKRFWDQAPEVGPDLPNARLPDGRRLGDIPGFIQWSSDQGRSAFGDVVFASTDAEAKHTSRRAEIEQVMKTDINAYYDKGLDKELAAILERDAKRGKLKA